MNEIILSEAFTRTFSNDPIIWGKWLLVFASFVLTIIIRIKFNIDDKFNPFKKLDKKVKKAIENNHVINAKLVKKLYSDSGTDGNPSSCSGKYEYELNEKKHYYTARFLHTTYPPISLHLFYEKTPKKLFTNEGQHTGNIFLSLISIILVFSPFIVAVLVAILLGLDKNFG